MSYLILNLKEELGYLAEEHFLIQMLMDLSVNLILVHQS